MSSSYTGNPATSHGNPIAITVPSDGDSATAASLNAPIEALADVVAHLQADAALKDANNTYTGTNDFTGGVVDVATPTANAHAATKAYADGQIVASGTVSSTGTILSTKGATWTVSKAGTGLYDIGLSGIQSSSIILATPHSPSVATSAVPLEGGAGTFRIHTQNLAGSAVDQPFSFALIQL